VTHLRQLMLEELRRRNFADSTIRSYLHGVEHFSRYFHRQPDQLGPEHIREYQAALFTKLKFSPNTVTLRLAALRFFYIQVLKRGWSIAETPYPKESFFTEIIIQDEKSLKTGSFQRAPGTAAFKQSCLSENNIHQGLRQK